jgi:hypothetical protein
VTVDIRTLADVAGVIAAIAGLVGVLFGDRLLQPAFKKKRAIEYFSLHVVDLERARSYPTI